MCDLIFIFNIIFSIFVFSHFYSCFPRLLLSTQIILFFFLVVVVVVEFLSGLWAGGRWKRALCRLADWPSAGSRKSERSFD